MRGEFPSDRDELERAIRHHLGAFLHGCDGPPPDLVRVTVEYFDHLHRHAIRCEFASDRRPIIPFPERVNVRREEACAITRQIYSGLFEDHMVNLEVRRMRRVYIEALERELPPDQLWELDRNIRERERHIREHHRAPPGPWSNVESPRRPGVPTHVRPSDYQGVSIDHVWRDELAQIDRLSVRLWSRELARNLEEVTYFGMDFGVEVGGKEAQAKGLALLKENLTPAQLQQYEKRKHFEVIGCDTRKLYRIRHGRQMNIEELDKRHRRVCGWCFLPSGGLVVGDTMLAQKIALETNERAALAIANRF